MAYIVSFLNILQYSTSNRQKRWKEILTYLNKFRKSPATLENRTSAKSKKSYWDSPSWNSTRNHISNQLSSSLIHMARPGFETKSCACTALTYSIQQYSTRNLHKKKTICALNIHYRMSKFFFSFFYYSIDVHASFSKRNCQYMHECNTCSEIIIVQAFFHNRGWIIISLFLPI